MAVAAGVASLKAGLMIAAPVLAVAAPLVLAALFLGPEGSTVHHPRVTTAQTSVRTGSGTNSVLMPALTSPASQAPSRARVARQRSARSSTLSARVGRTTQVGPVLTRVSSTGGGVGCATDGLQGLACGGAPAVRSAIQAQLSYDRLNTRCAALVATYGRGGLEGSLIYAINGAQLAARREGLTAQAEEAQVKRALQRALVVSGSAPKDVLAALSDLAAVYGGCEGYDSARNALLGTASLIQSQLGFDQPTATAGFGAAFANPGFPASGSLATSSYLSGP